MIHRGSLNKRLADFIVATLLGVSLFLLPESGQATSSVEDADVPVEAEESKVAVQERGQDNSQLASRLSPIVKSRSLKKRQTLKT